MAKAIFETEAVTDNPCVIHLGYFDKATGYGIKRQGKKLYKAHRLAYIKRHGEIDRKLHVDHMCHNEALAKGECKPGVCMHRRCVNPTHLRAVTASENFLAGGNGFMNRTHCKNGHKIAEVGIFEHKGIRQCAKCRRDTGIKAKQAYRERQKDI